ncbi:MAG: hypothetical protein KF802_04025 [Bdellovibrionaceae bacterium]|nr:hypothetical protein [Pseudobdellovibrionaceae bacterium]
MKRFFNRRLFLALFASLLIAAPAALMLTPWPLPLLAGFLAPSGVIIEEPQGSLWAGLSAREVRLERPGLSWQWREARFALDHELLLNEQKVVFQDWQAASGSLRLEQVTLELTDLRMQSLDWRPEGVFYARQFQASTPKGSFEMPSLRSDPPPFQAEIAALNGQLRVVSDADQLLLNLHGLQVQPLVAAAPPITLDQVELRLPRQVQLTPEFARQALEQLMKNPGRATLRLPTRSLSYDLACSCFRDEKGEFHLKLAEAPTLFTLTLDEYRREPEVQADEELLSGLIWSKTWPELSEEEKTQLSAWKEHVRFERPEPLPVAEKTFLDDYRLLQKVSKDRDLSRLFTRIKKSARGGAPAEVLYFASLLTVMGTDCEMASPWLAELTAMATTPALQAKTFSLLAQCEKDPVLKRKLLETANIYAPRDQVIKGFLLSSMLTGKDAKKHVRTAKRFLHGKDLEPEAALPVKNALLRMQGESRAPASQKRP